MAAEIQISTYISEDSKARMDRYARATGSTRASIIEQALQQYLRVLEEIPIDLIVPARVVLTPQSAVRVRELTSHPPAPTPAMKKLFDDR